MPKISNETIRINNDNLTTEFNIVITYNKKLHFNILLPTEFKEWINLLDPKKRQDKFINGFRGDYFVVGESEVEVKNRFKVIAAEVISSNIQRRNVIIITYKGDYEKFSHYRGSKDGKGEINISLELIYAEETSFENHKKYSQKSESEFLGETKIYYNEVRIDNDNDVVIDNTDENRLFLENLHSALQALNNKLSEFLSSSETVNKLISSNLALLEIK